MFLVKQRIFFCFQCSSYKTFFQNFISPEIMFTFCQKLSRLMFAAIKKNLMLALFFVHWTSAALPVIDCQKTCLRKDRLALRDNQWCNSQWCAAPRQGAPDCSCVQWCDVWTICVPCHKIALADVMGTDHSFAKIFMAVLSKDHSIHSCNWWSK